MRIRIVLGIAALLAAGCGDDGAGDDQVTTTAEVTTTGEVPPYRQVPEDFVLVYHWAEGSLPPPFHYEYTVTIGPTGEGTVEMVPDYPGEGVPVWVEGFTLDEEALGGLFWEVRRKRVFTTDWEADENPPVGGPSASFVITGDGEEVRIPAFPEGERDRLAAENLGDTVERAVPEDIWDDLEARLEEYRDSYSG